MASDTHRIQAELSSYADDAYRSFQTNLVPTVEPERILGVRTPALRRYARHLARTRPEDAAAFMSELPHRYYEENNLHGELIGLLSRTPADAFARIEAFAPFIDNWATCDLIRVPALRRDLAATRERIGIWCAAEPEYLVRLAIVTLMTLFLDEAFDPNQLELVCAIDRPEYYINMARAWYLSYALIKQPAAAITLFERAPRTLDAWTRNKALQKARESRRATDRQRTRFQELKARGQDAGGAGAPWRDVIIRAGRAEDAPALAAIFHDAVHRTCAADYPAVQLEAWAPAHQDPEIWRAQLERGRLVVAERGGRVLGFGTMEGASHLDLLFVAPAAQGRGIATALCRDLEGRARNDQRACIAYGTPLLHQPRLPHRRAGTRGALRRDPRALPDGTRLMKQG